MDVDQGDAVQEVNAANMVGLSPESRPVEVARLPNLGVNQKPEQGYDDGGDQGALILHELAGYISHGHGRRGQASTGEPSAKV